MPQKELETKLLPSFVKLRTTPDMRALAMKLAQIKKATGGIKKIESMLQNQNLTDEQFTQQMANLNFLTNYSTRAASEAIALMKFVQNKVEKYQKVM
jgi:uncharacterized tellurite resistance protein B-like protein